MKIHQETIPEIDRFLHNFGAEDLDGPEKVLQFENYLKMVRPYMALTPQTRMLEIGTGTGWFPVQCARKGLRCKGLEISPQLIDHARKLAAMHRVDVEIELGNVEESDIGDNQFDVIIGSSVFEHVEHWRLGLARVHKALKPGGVFFFSSTNKFSFISGEYGFPLYGWLPDQWRYKMRIARQGPEIMKLGIDFNQFRYSVLRREFRKLGFSRVLDLVDRLNPAEVKHPLKKAWLGTCKAIPPAKALTLTFATATVFVCVK
jgi:SAM-dependent methyltransferase